VHLGHSLGVFHSGDPCDKDHLAVTKVAAKVNVLINILNQVFRVRVVLGFMSKLLE
jgi:hypothetical protein